jgi:electron transfer flavoprotein beta subunit
MSQMEICVCVKRVPMVGGAIKVTPDGQEVDTAMIGFTVSPHEECAVEEAVQIIERLRGTGAGGTGAGGGGAGGTSAGSGGAGGGGAGGGGAGGTSAGSGGAGGGGAGASGAGAAGGGVTVLTLGPPEAASQLRDMLALGAGRAILLETGEAEWGPMATASAIADAVRGQGYDLLLFGNESADAGGYQVPIRVAHALGLPCATGIKKLEIVADGEGRPDRVRAGREYRGTEESFELPLPAVLSVKEGINLPRYPSLPGRLRARRAPIERIEPVETGDGLRKIRLRVPESAAAQARILGTGTDAVPALVELLDSLGVLL